MKRLVTKGIPKGDFIQEFGPSGIVRRGEGSIAFEMELSTSFLENITCSSEKEIQLAPRHFRGEIYEATYGNFRGESGGREVRNNGHDGLGRILIPEFICIKFMTIGVGFQRRPNFDSNYFYNIPRSFPFAKKGNFSLDS